MAIRYKAQRHPRTPVREWADSRTGRQDGAARWGPPYFWFAPVFRAIAP